MMDITDSESGGSAGACFKSSPGGRVLQTES